MRITRYYISVPDENYGERFWNGKRFTRYIDDCKLYTDKRTAKSQLIKLVNSGTHKYVELKESRYSI